MKGLNYNKIIFIVVDSLRPDHLGCYGYPFKTSPFIDKLAEEGTVFEKHYASDVTTSPSLTALISGERGIRNGILGFHHGRFDFVTSYQLPAEKFSKENYRTGIVTQLVRNCKWLARGFHYIHAPPTGMPPPRGDKITKMAKRWLNLHVKKDFFLLVHYSDPHGPLTQAPKKYKDKFSPEDYKDISPSLEKYFKENKLLKRIYTNYEDPLDPNERLSLYDSEICYADSEIQNLFEFLDEKDLAEEILVLITADHGASFGEHGILASPSCYDNISHIPLIIWKRGNNWPKRINEFTMGIDLFPTALDFANLQLSEGMEGKSLLPVLQGNKGRKNVVTNVDCLVTQRMFIEGDYALVHNLSKPIFRHLSTYEFFNLKKDPAQINDISNVKRKKFEEYKLKLKNWLSRKLKGSPDPLARSARKGLGFKWFLKRYLKNHPELIEDKEFFREAKGHFRKMELLSKLFSKK